MNLYLYTSLNNRRGAESVIQSYGGTPAPNPHELAQQLAFCVRKDGQNALDKIANVHPDKELIESKFKSEVPLIKETHSNACGCGSNFSGVDGQNAKAEVKSRLTDKTELLITGGIVLIGLAMVLKLMK